MEEGYNQKSNFVKLREKIIQIKRNIVIRQGLTNQETVQAQFKHCKKYQERLDYGDRPIIAQFNYQQPFSEQVFSQIQETIVQACQSIVSIAFKQLKRQTLDQSEAKVYAAKNILLNIQSIISEYAALLKISLGKYDEDFLQYLTNEVNTILKQILTQLAKIYPQAPVSGESQKMKDAIKAINRSDDQTKDIIYIYNLQIAKYLKKKQNDIYDIEGTKLDVYIDYIMKVINHAIIVARQDTNDLTVYQQFCSFNQKLIYLSSNQDWIKANDQKKLEYVKQKNKNKTKQNNEGRQEYIYNSEKIGIKFASGTKIPNHIKPFTESELKDRTHNASHSSILRIMTKWAEYLESFFNNPQILIKQRMYPFKDINHKLIDANDSDLKKQLIKKIKKQQQQVRKKIEQLKKKNSSFQAYFLSKKTEIKFSNYLKSFQEVRQAASKINFTLYSIMQQYLATLIHHLLKAGAISQEKMINLVSLRISDLIRSKIQCQEPVFINILKNMELLDKELSKKVKITRIKNKLDQKDNNIIINYLFMGKVECELQLSTQATSKKQKNNYAFSHFLYQLTRGKFEVISECGIIISQHDQIISSCEDNYYKPRRNQRICSKQTHLFQKISKKCDRYLCCECYCLIFNENITFFEEYNLQCNFCILKKSKKPEEKIRDYNLKKFIFQKHKFLKKITSYAELEQYEKGLLLKIRNVPKVTKFSVSLLTYKQAEIKWILVQIDDIFSSYNHYQIKINELSYMDISAKIKDKHLFGELTYYIDYQSFKNIDFKIYRDCFETQFQNRNVMKELNKIQDAFCIYLKEKELVDLIKSKNQIIQVSNDQKKAQILKNILKDHIKQKTNILHNPNFNFIKRLCLSSTNLSQINIEKFTQINYLNLSHNKLSPSIDLSQNILLTEINLQDNQLVQLDLKHNQKLVNINLWNNRIENFKVQNLKCLQSVYLRGNRLKQIFLTNLSNLLKLQAQTQQKKQIQKIEIINAPKIEEFSFDFRKGLQVNRIILKDLNKKCKIYISKYHEAEANPFIQTMKNNHHYQIK